MGKKAHQVTRWVEQNQMPTGRGFAKIRKYIRETEQRLIEALGGLEHITPQQEILIHSTIKALGVQLLVEVFINKHGPLRPDQLNKGVLELHPCLGQGYLSFTNTIRLNLTALGLKRAKVDEVIDLGKYLEMKERKNDHKK